MMSRVSWILVSWLLMQAPGAEAAAIRAEGDRLRVKTDVFSAEFRGATMTRLAFHSDHSSCFAGCPAEFAEDFVSEEIADLHGPGLGTWSVEDDVATYTKEWEGGGLSMEVRVDPQSGDLVITQSCAAAEKGVRSVGWQIVGLSPNGRIILPSNGGVSIDNSCLFRRAEFTYPFGWPDWSSQLLIFQRGGSSKKKGNDCGFSVWSTDNTAQFKRLIIRRRRGLFDVEFHTENPAPFTERDSCRSVQWRLNVHGGTWYAPAERYRRWMREAFDLIPWEGDVEWAKEIRTVVGTRGRSLHPEFLPNLAERVIPERTIIYVPDWRQDGYDVNYPDYTPGNYISDFITEAHRRGFRVMLHVNLPGISPRHPLYEEFKPFHAKDPLSLAPLGWHWQAQLPVTHAFIDPASSKYRELYVSLMERVIEQVGADALHLDVSAPMWNDGNGLIEGMNYPRGSMALHRALKDALPQVVFGGESINEVTLRGERFYQKWNNRGVGRPHPIESYLYGPYAVPVGYLGLPNPDESPGGYMAYAGDYEAWGVLPTIFCDIADPACLSRTRTRTLLAEARTWQEKLLRPDFDRAWKESEKFAWRGLDESEAVLERLVAGSVRMRIGEDVFYERIRGATEWTSGLVIPSWPAFAGNRHIGLDPEKEYAALPVERGGFPVRIVGLPPDMVIESLRADAGSAIFTLRAAPGRDSLSDDVALRLMTGRTGTTIDGKDQALQKGAHFDIRQSGHGKGSDVVFESICPWRPDDNAQDKAWGEVFVEADISPPAADGNWQGRALCFETAIADSATKGDGSTFRVTVNGEEVFSEWRRNTAWQTHSVSLDEFRGSLRIRLSLHPGPKNSVSYDLGLWRNPRIELVTKTSPDPDGSREPREVKIRTQQSLFASSVPPETEEGLLGFELSPEDSLVLFFEPVTEVTADVSLLEVPFQLGVEGMDVYTAGQRAWGSGSIMDVTAGEAILRGISGHPPSEGRTYIRQAVKINKDLIDPALCFVARLNEGAVTGGVGFLVLFNGEEVWSWSTSTPGFRAAEISLADYVGRPLLVEWVTDSLGDASFDWAIWADPRIDSGCGDSSE